MSKTFELATFGAGCFWGVESAFLKLEGVLETQVGYAGGTTNDPTYEQVCSNQTGHAEVVQVKFDPQQIAYQRLLEVFWQIHDPTTPNQQGPDVGTQYRSVVFAHSKEQEQLANHLKNQLQESKKFPAPIVTEILPAPTFFRAEEYHQKYFEKQGK